MVFIGLLVLSRLNGRFLPDLSWNFIKLIFKPWGYHTIPYWQVLLWRPRVLPPHEPSWLLPGEVDSSLVPAWLLWLWGSRAYLPDPSWCTFDDFWETEHRLRRHPSWDKLKNKTQNVRESKVKYQIILLFWTDIEQRIEQRKGLVSICVIHNLTL